MQSDSCESPSAIAPAVSVVMPLFNKQDSVLAAVSSVLAQSFHDWELIIVDDGSTDRSLRECSTITDPRIKIVRQPNAGVSAARNRGISAARADLVAFLDADDIWMPEFLDAINCLVRDFPDAAIFSTSYRFVTSDGRKFDARLRGPSGTARGILTSYFAIAAQSDPPICSSTTAVRRSALIRIGGFPEGIGSGEDLLTWARLAVGFPIARDNRALVNYEVSSTVRPADPENLVGRAINKLLQENPDCEGIGAYLGYWYYNQSVMAVNAGQRLLALRYAQRAICAAPRARRSWVSLFQAVLPRAITVTLHRYINSKVLS